MLHDAILPPCTRFINFAGDPASRGEVWNDHQPHEPLGVVLVARIDKELEMDDTLFAACTKLRQLLLVEPVVVGVMTSEIKECLLIGADVVVPFGSPPEKMLEPMPHSTHPST